MGLDIAGRYADQSSEDAIQKRYKRCRSLETVEGFFNNEVEPQSADSGTKQHQKRDEPTEPVSLRFSLETANGHSRLVFRTLMHAFECVGKEMNDDKP
jgi:hypothetical protein